MEGEDVTHKKIPQIGSGVQGDLISTEETEKAYMNCYELYLNLIK